MHNSLTNYWEALERLKQSKPVRVPRGTRITNDSVSLEAGRGKGSIKKSRPAFAALIAYIDEAATNQAGLENMEKVRLDKFKESASHLRQQLDAALGREVSLVVEIYELKKQLAQLTGRKVLPIRASPPPP